MMQISKTAIDQRAHEIERQGRALIAAQDHLRIRDAFVGRKATPIHKIAPEAG